MIQLSMKLSFSIKENISDYFLPNESGARLVGIFVEPSRSHIYEGVKINAGIYLLEINPFDPLIMDFPDLKGLPYCYSRQESQDNIKIRLFYTPDRDLNAYYILTEDRTIRKGNTYGIYE